MGETRVLEENQQLRKIVHALNIELQNERIRTSRLKQLQKESEEKITEIEVDLKEANNVIATLSSSLDEIDYQYKLGMLELQSNLKEKDDQMKSIYAEHDNIRSRNKTLKLEVQNFKERNVNEACWAEREPNVEVEKTIQSLCTKNDALRHELEQATKIINELLKEQSKKKQIANGGELDMNEVANALYGQKVEDLNRENSNLCEENRNYKQEHQICQDLRTKLEKTSAELKYVQTELDETKNRLSALMGQKLTDNNPNITDLSDRNRPTKLAERYSELYDNQWTDAFEKINTGEEEEVIYRLKNILRDAMDFCKHNAVEQMKDLTSALQLDGTGDGSLLPGQVRKLLKDCRKATAEGAVGTLYQKYIQHLKNSDVQQSKAALQVPSFTRECIEICWLMNVQDPPVVLDSDIQPGQPFRTEMYRSYTRSGCAVDYVVWPALFLCQDGAVLSKGVAQGRGEKKPLH